MKNRLVSNVKSAVTKLGCGIMAGLLLPGNVHGCACGCGVFDVGTSAMFPSGAGGMAYLQYAYQDQNRNWSGTSQAPAANNDDKEIATHFLTLGLQYLANRSWGVEAEIPYDFRYFKTMDSGSVVSRSWSQLGDLRIKGIYTGFFDDMSAGLTFGLKLPTGSFGYDADLVDRDSQIGTGSTDLLLGGFYRGNVPRVHDLEWFAQLQMDIPTLIQDGYRPGFELDTALGLDYTGFSLGRVQIVPVAQIIFSERTSDSGPNSGSPVASGYQRLMLSPGIEVHLHPIKFYADAEFPVYQNFTGYQLAAPVLFKLGLSFMF